MKIIYEDFNEHIESTFWQILANILAKMPLHLKYSDQLGLQGKLIFDPVGTNQYLKTELSQVGCLNSVIPSIISTYSQAHYSRQVVQSSPQNVRVVSGKSARYFLEINP